MDSLINWIALVECDPYFDEVEIKKKEIANASPNLKKKNVEGVQNKDRKNNVGSGIFFFRCKPFLQQSRFLLCPN